MKQVDVIKELKAVVDKNTTAYASDFDIDVRMFKAAMNKENPEKRIFLWMSRPHGTHCFNERDVFLKDSLAYNTWVFYLEQDLTKGILVFRVELTGVEDNRIIGNITPMRYAVHAARVMNNAVPIEKRVLIYEKGTVETLPDAPWDDQRHPKFGELLDFWDEPVDQYELKNLLEKERRR